MVFDDLTITSDYSDYDIWRGKYKLYPKMVKFGSKLKIYMERESTINFL